MCVCVRVLRGGGSGVEASPLSRSVILEPYCTDLLTYNIVDIRREQQTQKVLGARHRKYLER